MNEIQQKGSKKFHYNYICKNCDYYTNRKSQYERHLQTKKHNTTNTTKIQQKSSYNCECGKSYNHRASLFNHKKTCTYTPEEENIKIEITEQPTQNNQDISSLLLRLIETNEDLKEQIIELASKPQVVNTNSNNNSNNTFNLNNFLHIHCRDAMNLSDFIEEIQITFNDLLYLGNNGFVEAFKDTFIKRLKNMEQNKRPIHCTDQKRKACVVKENDKWEKENTEVIIYNAVDKVNRKQIGAFSHHARTRDKDYLDDETNLDNNSKIIIEMCGYNQKNAEAMHKKIMKQIADNTTINKQFT